MIKNLKAKHTQMSSTWQRPRIRVFFEEASNTKWKETPINRKVNAEHLKKQEFLI